MMAPNDSSIANSIDWAFVSGGLALMWLGSTTFAFAAAAGLFP